MSGYRSVDSLTSQLRNVLLDNDEIKEAQFVGESQIVVKEYVSSRITTTSTSSGYIGQAFAVCTVTSEIADGNILITYCCPEVRINGTLIDNKSDAYSMNVTIIDTESDKTNAFQVSIYHTATSDTETIPVENFTVKFHVWSAATIGLTARSGTYE